MSKTKKFILTHFDEYRQFVISVDKKQRFVVCDLQDNIITVTQSEADQQLLSNVTSQIENCFAFS